MLPANVPPVYVPVYFSMTVAPDVPALDENVMVAVAEPPFAAIVPNVCGNGDPLALPRVAVVNCTLLAAPVPLLVTFTTA